MKVTIELSQIWSKDIKYEYRDTVNEWIKLSKENATDLNSVFSAYYFINNVTF